MSTGKIAFLGGLYPDDTTSLLNKAKVGLDYAADAYQKKYLTCFRNLGVNNIKIFSRLFLGNYPQNFKQIYVRERGASQYGDIEYIDYFNLVLFRNQAQYVNTVKAVSEWYENDRKSAVLFVYSPCFSKEVIRLKKKYPELKICLIIPDLPRFTYLSDKSKIRRLRCNLNQKLLEKSCRVADYCICITEKMKDYLSTTTGISCSVIEAIADKERCEERLSCLEKEKLKPTSDKSNKIIAYTGTLAKKYGVLDLMQAFEQIQDRNCELHICGDGDAATNIVLAAKKDTRIHFYGSVPHERAKSIQEAADVLVNPRKNEGMYTSYSFPSKTMEYLETGNIVVCHKLNGIPNDYHNLVIHPTGSGVNDLAKALEQGILIGREEIIRTGCERLVYLLNNKCGNSIRDILDNLTENKSSI